MLSLEVKTKMAPEVVSRKIKSYFGSDGYGLELKDDCENLITLEGGGGYVAARLCLEGKQTRVDLTTREWEQAVKQFVASLP